MPIVALVGDWSSQFQINLYAGTAAKKPFKYKLGPPIKFISMITIWSCFELMLILNTGEIRMYALYVSIAAAAIYFGLILKNTIKWTVESDR